MMTWKRVALAMAFGIVSVPAMAGEIIDPVPQRPSVADDPIKGDPNRLICRREPILGSRLGTNRRCMTAAEWAQVRLDNRMRIERAQKDRPTMGQ